MAESQRAVFECEVANPESEGQWLQNGRPLATTDQFRAESDGVKRRLVIPATKMEDMGEYSYEIASSKTSAKLKVEGQYFLELTYFFETYCSIAHYILDQALRHKQNEINQIKIQTNKTLCLSNNKKKN